MESIPRVVLPRLYVQFYIVPVPHLNIWTLREREALQQRVEHGDEERLANTLTGGDPFVLRHAVHGI